MMEYLIQTQGFNAYEQELLTEQLKVLSRRLSCQWSYRGEGRQAHVIFSRRKLDLPSTQMQVLVVDQSERYSGSHLAEKNGVYFIEMPLRILGLLDILTIAESRKLQATGFASSSDHSASHQLHDIAQDANSNQIGVIDYLHAQVVLVRDVEGEWVLQSTEDRNALIKILLNATENGVKLDAVYLDHHTVLPNYEHTFPLKQFIWELVLAEPVMPGEHDRWEAKSLRLNQWPSITEWGASSVVVMLASLYSKGFAEVGDGVKSGACLDDVLRFLRACELAGLGLERAAYEAPRGFRDSFPSVSLAPGLMGRFREKLGGVLPAAEKK